MGWNGDGMRAARAEWTLPHSTQCASSDAILEYFEHKEEMMIGMRLTFLRGLRVKVEWGVGANAYRHKT